MLLTPYFTSFWQAGIGSRDNPEQLLIALEPEAAAIFCTDRKLNDPTPEKVSVEGQLSARNSHYMVVDIGGKWEAYSDGENDVIANIGVIVSFQRKQIIYNRQFQFKP